MAYQTKEIEIKGTNDYDVARALAYLAGFPREGSVVRHRSPGSCAYREVILFHEDTVKNDPDLFLFLQPPDIIVNALLPEGKYSVEFNERIDSSLINGVEDEIRRAYSMREESE